MLFGHRRLAIPLIISGVILFVLGVALLALAQTQQVMALTQQANFREAATKAQRIKPIVVLLDSITFSQVSDLHAWRTGLELPEQLSKLTESLHSVTTSFAQEDGVTSLTQLETPLLQLETTISKLAMHLSEARFIRNRITPESQALIASLPSQIADIRQVVSLMSEGNQTWIVVFQNSNELRATGGFPGSYALVELQEGVLAQVVIEDIYDADGQFEGYITPPAGIKQYTSANRGLRLPDSNWSPDFPTSAQSMLQFFALGDKTNISGLVTVNLETAQALLDVTGPLFLPDYDTEVSAATIDEVLRAQRDTFFPGSKQKKHLLAQTITQLKSELVELNYEQQQQLVLALKRALQLKHVQAYSNKPTIQEIFSKYGITGAVGTSTFAHSPVLQVCNCQPALVMLVESNVGINKVNKYIERTIQIDLNNEYATISAKFTNTAAPLTATELSALLQEPASATKPQNGNGYLNYYRLLVPDTYQLEHISIGELRVTQWDEELIQTSTDQQLRQIGVLVAVPEQQSTTISFSLKSDQAAPAQVVLLPKQSGLPPTAYVISTPRKTQELWLEKDTVVSLD